jgi:hypothetical protein
LKTSGQSSISPANKKQKIFTNLISKLNNDPFNSISRYRQLSNDGNFFKVKFIEPIQNNDKSSTINLDGMKQTDYHSNVVSTGMLIIKIVRSPNWGLLNYSF